MASVFEIVIEGIISLVKIIFNNGGTWQEIEARLKADPDIGPGMTDVALTADADHIANLDKE